MQLILYTYVKNMKKNIISYFKVNKILFLTINVIQMYYMKKLHGVLNF